MNRADGRMPNDWLLTVRSRKCRKEIPPGREMPPRKVSTRTLHSPFDFASHGARDNRMQRRDFLSRAAAAAIASTSYKARAQSADADHGQPMLTEPGSTSAAAR